MSYLADIQAYLIAQGVGDSSNIFINFMPASPATAMGLFGYQGSASTFTTEGGEVARPGIQIKVRHQTPESAWAWMAQVKAALKGISNTTINGTKYLSIRPVGSASPAGWSNLSITLVQNYEAVRSE